MELLKNGYTEADFSREHLCVLHNIEAAKKIRETQEEQNSKTIRRKRKYAHGQQNNATTRTSCLKDILSPKSSFLKVENQQRNVEKALDTLKFFVVNEEELSQ